MAGIHYMAGMVCRDEINMDGLAGRDGIDGVSDMDR